MRLIDADALMKEFAKFVRRSNNSDFAPIPTWNDAVSLTESAPTVSPDMAQVLSPDMAQVLSYECGKDSVQVVRCKECKWFGSVGCAIKTKPQKNDYCSYGERRSE